MWELSLFVNNSWLLPFGLGTELLVGRRVCLLFLPCTGPRSACAGKAMGRES